MAEKKVIVQKRCSILTHRKGTAHAGAVLSAKDFSSQEVFDDLCEKAESGETDKVKVVKEPETAREPDPPRVEKIEEVRAKEPEKESEQPKKNPGRPKGAAKRNK